MTQEGRLSNARDDLLYFENKKKREMNALSELIFESKKGTENSLNSSAVSLLFDEILPVEISRKRCFQRKSPFKVE